MNAFLGPIPRSRIILCSADAGPRSQRTTAERADHFFPGAAWVGAIRNAAARQDCRFLILTTGHGLVGAGDLITPCDAHIDAYRAEVADRWRSTVLRLLSNYQNSLLIFYAGGCPREQYLELLTPNLRPLGISLITFGRPNMYDVDKTEKVVGLLQRGATLDEVTSGLSHPERLEFYFHAG